MFLIFVFLWHLSHFSLFVKMQEDGLIAAEFTSLPVPTRLS